MNLREVAKQALEALENSIDTVRHEYTEDWRHGLPTRKAQLDGMKKSIDNHEQAITDLRAALGEPQAQQTPPVEPAGLVDDLCLLHLGWKSDAEGDIYCAAQDRVVARAFEARRLRSDLVDFRSGVRCAERAHGIGGNDE